MFYSINILQKKGPLGNVWIAAHYDVAKKLKKEQIMSTDLVKTAGEIKNPEAPFSLRLSSHLLNGLCKIYIKKVDFLHDESENILTRFTLKALAPTNVDLVPSKAQLKQITIDENAIQMDIDLDIDFDEASWLGQTLSSQASAAEITLPASSTRKRQGKNSYEDEDTLLGANWGGGDNPLDFGFDDQELSRSEAIDELPEKHRSSDQVSIDKLGKSTVDSSALDMPELPDFDVDVSNAFERPSDVAASSLPATPGMKSVADQSALAFDQSPPPSIAVKKAVKHQAKKKRVNPLDRVTEIPREKMQSWIKGPDATKDIVRVPRNLPITPKEVASLKHSELVDDSSFAEFNLSRPYLRFVGSGLKAMFTQLKERETLSKKRKEREVEEETQTAADDTLHTSFDELDRDLESREVEPEPAFGADPEISHLEQEMDVQNQENVYEYDAVAEEEEQAAEANQGVTIEQQERTKKFVVMLQKHFKRTSSGKPLALSNLVKMDAPAAPNRHTAAVAFFECLNLCSKGAVDLAQGEPFADLLINSTPALPTFKVA